jgi:drug/metabolite transporter (DMT)-like permease
LVVLATVFWSTAGFFTRLIPLDSWGLLFWRGLLAALLCAVVLAWQFRASPLAVLRGFNRLALSYSIVAAFAMSLYLGALRLTTVAHVTVIYTTIPFLSAAVAWVVLGERASRAALVASAVASVGVALTVGGGWGEGDVLGDVLAFLMTLVSAGLIVISRGWPALPMLPIAGVSAGLSAVMALPFTAVAVPSGPDLVNLTLFALTNIVLGLALFMRGARHIPAVDSALITALEGPLGPLWVFLAFGETPRLATIVGGALVVGAVVVHVVMEERARRSSTRTLMLGA